MCPGAGTSRLGVLAEINGIWREGVKTHLFGQHDHPTKAVLAPGILLSGCVIRSYQPSDPFLMSFQCSLHLLRLSGAVLQS